MLAHYDPKVKTLVASDSNDYSVGAVTLHNYEDGKIKDFAQDSTLASTEREDLQPDR